MPKMMFQSKKNSEKIIITLKKTAKMLESKKKCSKSGKNRKFRNNSVLLLGSPINHTSPLVLHDSASISHIFLF